MSNFILTLKLNTEIFQNDILNKRFEISRLLYNSCLNHLYEQYDLLKQTILYRTTISNIKYLYRQLKKATKKKDQKVIKKDINNKYKDINKLYKDYGLEEYQLHSFLTPLRKPYEKHIDANTAQKIATTVWRAFEKMLFGNAKKVFFKRQGDLKSVEGKSNKTGIRFKDNLLYWLNLEIPIVINKNDVYAQEALTNKIKYCRIVRKLIRGKYIYYFQLVLEGSPPIKYNKETGEIRNPINTSRTGIDTGPQVYAVSSLKEVKLQELAPMISKTNQIIVTLQRKLDRQRRSNNPDNYNDDGTIKRGIKLPWNYSNKYLKTKLKLSSIQSKQANLRKQSHNKQANKILSCGDEIYYEKLSWKGMQSRNKNTTKDKNGKFNKKKRFGKSLAHKAPSMFETIINNKLSFENKKMIAVNKNKFKASQYNHFEDKYIKKELKDRWIEVDGKKYQRDLYSAFLLMCSSDCLEKPDRDLCNKYFENFKILHDEEINHLKKTGIYKRLKALSVV